MIRYHLPCGLFLINYSFFSMSGILIKFLSNKFDAPHWIFPNLCLIIGLFSVMQILLMCKYCKLFIFFYAVFYYENVSKENRDELQGDSMEVDVILTVVWILYLVSFSFLCLFALITIHTILMTDRKKCILALHKTNREIS